MLSPTCNLQDHKSTTPHVLFESYRDALKASVLPFLGHSLDRLADDRQAELDELLLLLHRAFPEQPSPGWAVKATLRFNRMIIAEELDYRERAAYRRAPQDAADVNQLIYQSAETMTGFYLAGLLLSYFTWPHHTALLSFYRESFLTGRKPGTVMEWGVGHGLFTLHAKRQWPNASLVALDISEHSLDFTKRLLEADGTSCRPQFVLGDILAESLVLPTVDRLVCAEVLEHVADPKALLQRVADCLLPGGVTFLTAAINAPQPDHIFHFRDAGEVEELVRAAGLVIRAKRSLTHPHRARQSEAPTVLALIAAKELG